MKETILLLIIGVFLVGCTGTQPLIDPSEYDTESDFTETFVAKEGIEEGDRAPNFTVTTIRGENVSLSDFTVENKPVLLYFMATWCPYCAKDYEELSKIYDQYNVEILSIDLDLTEDAEILQEYIKKYPALNEMKLALGNIDVLAKYQVRSTTTKYAISSKGTILYKGSGAFTQDQWSLLLQTLESS